VEVLIKPMLVLMVPILLLDVLVTEGERLKALRRPAAVDRYERAAPAKA
jgi:hypothetical protein